MRFPYIVAGGIACLAVIACDPNDTGTGGGSVCGNGIVEAGEQCDDGNSNDNDACDQACKLPVCGNGVVQTGEQCDDGDVDDTNACNNSCVINPSVCGDGVVQAGEDCDDGNTTDGDACPSNCILPSGGGGSGAGSGGGGACSNVTTFAGGAIGNHGAAWGPVWQHGGEIGTAAGDSACKQIGADHVCDYEEIALAESKQEPGWISWKANGMPFGTSDGKTFWLHRLTPILSDGQIRPPSAGSRCNDWTYPTNHVADGEYVLVNANGTLTYFIDANPCYTGDAATGCSSTSDTLSCGGKLRAIPCCFPLCVP